MRDCDVCNKRIGRFFRVIQVFIANQENLKEGSFTECEKEIAICNSCVLELNFRKIKRGEV